MCIVPIHFIYCIWKSEKTQKVLHKHLSWSGLYQEVGGPGREVNLQKGHLLHLQLVEG
ncbi:hypothetical protein PVAP13_9NG156273 [Panicum virgatum]|uniref:Uncharacterized protein n=1 Tax=Panicum virgatum TaxID=38727 RepID=A0A8T0MH61_PANVG|nr:hypothetical protein PVAP13_9NG156273 [Panicum virgatum]